MTDKIYYLASCDTCRKIIKSLPNADRLQFHDIRQNPITEQELEEMYQLSGSYEALFSKKAQLYKSMDLKNKSLTEVSAARARVPAAAALRPPSSDRCIFSVPLAGSRPPSACAPAPPHFIM